MRVWYQTREETLGEVWEKTERDYFVAALLWIWSVLVKVLSLWFGQMKRPKTQVQAVEKKVSLNPCLKGLYYLFWRLEKLLQKVGLPWSDTFKRSNSAKGSVKNNCRMCVWERLWAPGSKAMTFNFSFFLITTLIIYLSNFWQNTQRLDWSVTPEGFS